VLTKNARITNTDSKCLDNCLKKDLKSIDLFLNKYKICFKVNLVSAILNGTYFTC